MANVIKQYVSRSMLLSNVVIATMESHSPYGLIKNGAIVIDGSNISWVGTLAELPTKYKKLEEIDLKGRVVTPALIDCHTHIVHGGNRANEFEMRLNGASYEEVSKAGGGIISTVNHTRESSENDLLKGALKRVDALISEGVGTIEIKSGYGLDIESEIKMLKVARLIESKRPINIKTSFLGAHAIPSEFKETPDKYIDDVCLPALSRAALEGLVDAVDGFCEGIAFDTKQIERVFKHAKELGFPVKLHAEQLSNMGGTKLVSMFNGLSADHLEYANDEDVKALANSRTVAVLLPGAFYTIHETQLPPIQSFRDHNVPIAVATDCNPGSSPLASILLAMNMGCTLFRLTPEEGLLGTTKNAARALGMSTTGVIRAGYAADLAIWDISHPCELAYRIGFNPIYKRVFGGKI